MAREPQHTVKRFDGTPVNEGDQLQVDNNLPVTYLGIACPPWGDDATGEWNPGRITVRYSWGAVEEITDNRADVFVDEV
ncbi:hypothetical protein [Streptomyces sp. AD55]|uniref:hypothetical protein n=1 Tax=Streptomyces sp. AD55 TaxID=3242895 RepID=UPI003528C1D5